MHNKFVVNVLEGAMSVKSSVGRPRLQYLKAVAVTQELTDMQQCKVCPAIIPAGKPLTNQKTEG